MTIRSRWLAPTAALIAASALALVGCGGGSPAPAAAPAPADASTGLLDAIGRAVSDLPTRAEGLSRSDEQQAAVQWHQAADVIAREGRQADALPCAEQLALDFESWTRSSAAAFDALAAGNRDYGLALLSDATAEAERILPTVAPCRALVDRAG
jgi:hypothetical protein